VVKSVVQAAQEEKVGGLQFEVILGKSLKKKKKPGVVVQSVVPPVQEEEVRRTKV
jgi:hypothetical protein